MLVVVSALLVAYLTYVIFHPEKF
ncbi:K(+)-transporting ATPase subunit F [Alicyclobacillus sp. SP_1]